ncbi:hypothetical protein COO60DRAFT_355009 [Scenedesmus sp. NREL 46B-D3]|nr:hypothetical protein COO60DRAFT_355009 [Scenedesmus sp. NREL 46B-D3]
MHQCRLVLCGPPALLLQTLQVVHVPATHHTRLAQPLELAACSSSGGRWWKCSATVQYLPSQQSISSPVSSRHQCMCCTHHPTIPAQQPGTAPAAWSPPVPAACSSGSVDAAPAGVAACYPSIVAAVAGGGCMLLPRCTNPAPVRFNPP